MAKLITCKSCGKEVAKGAKVCPHCGQKLKMGFFAKFGIAIVVLIGLGIFLSPSAEDFAKQLAEVENSNVDDVRADGEIANIFGLMTDNTDIQRDNMEKELKGKVVSWSLPVYEVKLTNKEKMEYKIQTSSGTNNVGAFVEVYARNADEVAYIEGLKTGDIVSFKGKIDGVFMRNITIEKARLTN